jgi:hypothetical protein
MPRFPCIPLDESGCSEAFVFDHGYFDMLWTRDITEATIAQATAWLAIILF